MAKKKIYGLDEESFRRVKEATRRVLGRPSTGAQRRRQAPVIGGSSESEKRLYFLTMGDPSGGYLSIKVRVTIPAEDEEEDDEVEDSDVLIYAGASLQEIKTAFESHSLIEEGQIVAHAANLNDDSDDIGAFPQKEIWITSKDGLSLSQVEFLSINTNNLIGGSHLPYTIEREDR